MGKDCGSWLNQQHSAWQSPNLICTSTLQDQGQRDTLPGLVASEGPGLRIGQGKEEPCGWFYCLPRHRQAYVLTPNSVLKEKLNAFSHGCGEDVKTNAVSGSGQKRFLVFDQTGNQTSLIFSSVIGSSFPHPACRTPKPFDSFGRRDDELVDTGDQMYVSGPIQSDGSDENHNGAEGSEMHEDTEELNALLYSDDDYDFGDDDEETSTGHSPETATEGFEKLEQMDRITEEVASSGNPTKRRRLPNGGYNTSSSLMDTASSVNPHRSNEYEDYAESTCAEEEGRDKVQVGRGCSSLSGNKRSRKKERIQETVSILQSIIPGGKGKDAMLVLDEAISYLGYLKLKAKKTLGDMNRIRGPDLKQT